MHEVLVNRLGGLGLPRKSVVRLTDRPDMTFDVYRGRKTTIQPNPSLETSRRDGSNEGHTYVFVENKEKLSLNYLQYLLLFGALFSTISRSALFFQIKTILIILFYSSRGDFFFFSSFLFTLFE